MSNTHRIAVLESNLATAVKNMELKSVISWHRSQLREAKRRVKLGQMA